jgi:hypothetical protein
MFILDSFKGNFIDDLVWCPVFGLRTAAKRIAGGEIIVIDYRPLHFRVWERRGDVENLYYPLTEDDLEAILRSIIDPTAQTTA